MKIFSGTSNKPLAQKIAKNLGLQLSDLEVFVFPDGEKRIRILDKVVGEDIVVVQSTSFPTDENYMQLFFILDALKRNGAKSVTVIIPYFGYQRQDHMFRIGEAVSVKVVAKILETLGINKLIAIDLHSIKIEQAFNISVIHLSALSVFAEKIKKLRRGPVAPSSRPTSSVAGSLRSLDGTPSSRATPPSDIVLVSPDMGGIRRIKILSKMLNNMPYAVIEKDRDLATGKVTADKIQGRIREKVIIVDDMISSGGTIALASKILKEKGAKEISVFATHPVFSDQAPKILQDCDVKKVYVADTIFVPEEKRFPKLEILSVSELISTSLSS